MVVQAIMAPLALNRVNQPLTEATNQSVDDLDDDAMQVSQLCTLAQLADDQLIWWMSLNQVTLNPKDYLGIQKDLTWEELECRQVILASLWYDAETKQYTVSLLWRDTNGPSTNTKPAYALTIKILERLEAKDKKLLFKGLWRTIWLEILSQST